MSDTETKIQNLKNLCRLRSIPFTVQRRTTFEVLLPRNDHPTADQVFENVHAILPGISRMTVYRGLHLLVKFGLVKKISHCGTAARFDPNPSRHHHLLCLECNELIDFEAKELDSLDSPRFAYSVDFEILDYSVQFRGICRECNKMRHCKAPAEKEVQYG